MEHNVFSRSGYAICLLSKSRNEVLVAIKKITDRERFESDHIDKENLLQRNLIVILKVKNKMYINT